MSRGWWMLTLLVARRERVSARSFRISTVILVIGVAAAVGIPALVSGSSGPGKVGIVGSDQAALAATARQTGSVLGEKVQVTPFTSQAAGEAQLRKGNLDALYVGGHTVLIEQEPAEGASDTTAKFAGAVVVLIYLLIFIYGQRITSGLVEEKSSRVVEVLLASVRPAQLLGGKVIGMGATAFGQVAALVVTFLIVATTTGSNLLHGAAIGVVTRRRPVDGARLRALLHRVRGRRLSDHARVRCGQRHLPGRAAAPVRVCAVIRNHLRRLEQRPV